MYLGRRFFLLFCASSFLAAQAHAFAHEITFAPGREINPAWSAVGSCLIAAALILIHSAKFRK
jgi:hypothetical protein